MTTPAEPPVTPPVAQTLAPTLAPTGEPVRRPPLEVGRLTAAPWPVEVLAEAGSTNALLADRARTGAGPQVLVTEHQVAGRGRRDRGWTTPDRAALTFSVLLRPDVPPGRWPWLPLLVGVAAVEALPAGFATLKWPNDVLVADRKLAGILVERVDTPTGPAAVAGMGLNVSTTAAELPVPTATSLGLEGRDVDRTELLLALLDRLATRYDAWRGAARRAGDGAGDGVGDGTGDGGLRAAYTTVCATVGRRVRVELPGGRVLAGEATRVDEAGRLVVRTGAEEVAVSAGDVVHVREDR